MPDIFHYFLSQGAVTKLMAERPEAVWQIVTAIAAIETVTLFKNGQGAAGDLGFDPLDLQTKLGFKEDQSLFDEMKLRELKNGRLAMIGTSALLLQEVVTGYGPYEQLLKH
jgi:Chlorophyll A-B binding protein